jgi:hypothetical protein
MTIICARHKHKYKKKKIYKETVCCVWQNCKTVLRKFTVHQAAALLNKHDLETQNGVTTTESCVCVCVVLGAEIHD